VKSAQIDFKNHLVLYLDYSYNDASNYLL